MNQNHHMQQGSLDLNPHKSKFILQTILFSLWKHTLWNKETSSASPVQKRTTELGEFSLLTTGEEKELMRFEPASTGIALRVVRTLEEVYQLRNPDESWAQVVIRQAIQRVSDTAGKKENCLCHLAKSLIGALPHEGPWKLSPANDQLLSSTGHTILFLPPDVPEKTLTEILKVRSGGVDFTQSQKGESAVVF